MRLNWYKIARLINKAKWREDSPMDALYTLCMRCGKWATSPQNTPQESEQYIWKSPSEFDPEERQEASSVAKYLNNPSLGERTGIEFSHGLCPKCLEEYQEEIRQIHPYRNRSISPSLPAPAQ